MIMVTSRSVNPFPIATWSRNCRLGVYEFACSFHVKLHNKRKSTCKSLRQITVTFFRLSWVPEKGTEISKCQMHKETCGARWCKKKRGSRSRIPKKVQIEWACWLGWECFIISDSTASPYSMKADKTLTKQCQSKLWEFLHWQAEWFSDFTASQYLMLTGQTLTNQC